MTPAVSDSDLDAVSSLQVTGAGPARGSLQVPGDKSISHRAVLMAGMAHGPTVITGLSRGQDMTHALGAVQQFGVAVTYGDEGRVRWRGRSATNLSTSWTTATQAPASGSRPASPPESTASRSSPETASCGAGDGPDR
jgi:5-enolpyruvylshikimate-3-phosphate synthase